MPSIMYVCDECAENNPEACGHYDTTRIAVMPDGSWLCEDCYDEAHRVMLETLPDAGGAILAFSDMPHPKPITIT